MMDPRILRIERLLTKRNASIVLAAITVLTLFFAAGLRNVRLDHDFEKFFPTDDPELDRYLAYRDRFGNDNDNLLIGAARGPHVFDRSFLLKLDSMVGQLEGLPDVLTVVSPTRMQDPRITPVGVFNVPFLRLDHDSTLASDSARIWRDARIREAFFAEDGKALLVVMQTAPDLSKERSDALMIAVDSVVSGSGLADVRMGGRIHGQYWYIQKMQTELVLFFSLSILLLAIFLAVGFRTVWGVLVPIGVVGLTVLWQVGMITLLGKPLSILTMLLPTILFVVGMSDVVHILERYIEALRNGHSKARALAISYHEVGLATFLTSLTTAIGFATLMTSGILPIREFGLYTGAGVFLAFGLAFTLLPAVLLLVATPVQAATNERDGTWYPVLHRLYRGVLRWRRVIPLGFMVLSVISALFISRLKVDNQLLEDWPDDDPQKQEYFWFEDHFGGVRPFELQISVHDSAARVWDLDLLQAAEQVQQFLEQDYGVKAILSPVTLVKSLNKAFNGGADEFYRLPDDQREVDRLVKRAELLMGTDGIRQLASPDGRYARLSGRMVDEGGHVHAQRNRELDDFVRANTPVERVAFSQTGMAYLVDRSNAKLSSQLIGGLSIAFALIALIMARVFRDWRMTMIALVPNIVPLLVVGGVMGITGIDIKVSTAIIFTIAFGIAVDDTIHMLGKLRIELLKGKTLPYAMKRAVLSTGKALIVTSIMLLSGFISLIFSDFASVFYMGLLVSMTLLMALVADLLLLPVLVLRFLPRRKSGQGMSP
jgi:predicted RND superfamily exporter protein